MMDLTKPSHDRYSKGFVDRILDPEMTLARRNRYLDLANNAEALGDYKVAELLRRLAVGLPVKI